MGNHNTEETDFNSQNWVELRQKILARDRNKCFACGSRRALTVHHIKARADGGGNDPRNLITLCDKCHDYIEGEDWNFIIQLKSMRDEEKELSKHKKDIVKYGYKIDMYRYRDGELIKIGERYEL